MRDASNPQPDTTAPSLVAEEIVPASSINLPAYNDKLAQVGDSPYYHLKWERYWDSRNPRGTFRSFPPNREQKLKLVLTVGMRTEVEEEIKKTVAVAFRFGASAADPTGQIPVSANIGLDITNTEENRRLSTTSTSQEKTKEVEETVKAVAHQSAFKIWSLVNRYTLWSMDGKLEKEWESVLTDPLIQAFPELEAQHPTYS